MKDLSLPSLPHGIAKRFFYFALFWLMLAAGLGALLRYSFLDAIPYFNYAYSLHTHSHLMFLGWVFNALAGALLFALVAEANYPKYERIFWVLQISILGMLIAFPIQGYARFSIAFAGLHTLGAGWFAYCFWQDTRVKHLISNQLARWALLFMLLSNLGPLALGIIKAQGGGDSVAYKLALYFYLHFQYNAWFILAILALFWAWLEQLDIKISAKKAQNCLNLMVLSSFLSYSLSTLWAKPGWSVYLLAQISAVLQVGAWLYFSQILWQVYPKLEITKLGVKVLLSISYLAFTLKIVLQFWSALPVASWFFETRPLIIAYLHLVFLGVVSFFLLAYFSQKQFFCLCHWLGKIGAQGLILSLGLTEIILILPPHILNTSTHLWSLFGLAGLMFVATILIFLQAVIDFE
ncbi:MAG: hypothetical protein MUE85_08440 [Microscillaceae bacterium]|nr:hypothetical protein [Microscillaceae bacterium]